MNLNRRIEHWYRSLSLAQQWFAFLAIWIGVRVILNLLFMPLLGWKSDLLDVLGWPVGGSVFFFTWRWYARRRESSLPASDKSDDRA
jgi:hypothetical protein